MTFQINGEQGKYKNYGRNAVENNIQYMETPLVNDKHTSAPILDFRPTAEANDNNIAKLEKFANENDAYLKSLPPLEFEYRYMPQGGFNKTAVLGAAYEELGAKELPVETFEARYLPTDEMTAEPMDINKDGKIDIAEYGANIIASDILSKGTEDVTKADGTINSKGLNAIMEYSMKSRAEAAAKLYSNIYKTYDLGSGLDSFTIE